MKAATFFIGLLIALSCSADAQAQVSRRDYNGNGNNTYASSNNTSRYGYDNTNTVLSRRERIRLQARLENREESLANWEYDLNLRQAALDGRRFRGNAPSRYRYTSRILTPQELYAWEARLDRLESRLIERERQIDRAERISRSRNNRGNDRGNSRGGNRGNSGGGAYCPPY